MLALLAVLACAYGAGWVADAALNDDPCSFVPGATETGRFETRTYAFPARTDCFAVSRSDKVRGVLRGSPEVFLGVFAATIVAGLALLAALGLLLRLAIVAAAGLVALVVIFL